MTTLHISKKRNKKGIGEMGGVADGDGIDCRTMTHIVHTAELYIPADNDTADVGNKGKI